MESVRMAIAMVLTLIASYLIGCANFAIIISKLVYHKDIRDYGSGNAGMTNIARTFGKWPAVACTIGDFLKGDDRGPAGASVRHHPRGRGGV